MLACLQLRSPPNFQYTRNVKRWALKPSRRERVWALEQQTIERPAIESHILEQHPMFVYRRGEPAQWAPGWQGVRLVRAVCVVQAESGTNSMRGLPGS